MNAFLRAFALALCSIVAVVQPCAASFHLWKVKEVFSNQDGTVQFVELFTTAAGEIFLTAHDLTATSDGNVVKFTLNHDVASPSTNKHLLLATAGFASLAGGIAPDYAPLPANFFNPNAASITINFAGVDSITFAGSALPKDGVNSLTDQAPGGVQNLVAGVNSPTNYAGAVGSVNIVPPVAAADFNGDGAVNGLDLSAWRVGFGASGAAATKAAGNADGDGDVDGADFLAWQQGSGPSTIASVPEPTTFALLASACMLATWSVLARRLLANSPRRGRRAL